MSLMVILSDEYGKYRIFSIYFKILLYFTTMHRCSIAPLYMKPKTRNVAAFMIDSYPEYISDHTSKI